MPSPTMTVGPQRAFASDDGDLVGRTLLGDDVVDADHGADGGPDVGAVAGDHDDPPDAGSAEAADRPGGVGSDRVAQDEGARGCAIHPDEHAHRAVELAELASGHHPRLVAPHADQAALADRNVVIADLAADARTGDFGRSDRQLEDTSSVSTGPHDRGCQHVRGDLIERCGQPEHLVGVEPFGGHDLDQHRPAGRERAGLVEQQDLGVGQPLEWPAALARSRRDGRRGRGRRRWRPGQRGSAGTAWRPPRRRPPDSAHLRSPTPPRPRPR